MRIKNWKKIGKNCWKLVKKPKKKLFYKKICMKRLSKDLWVLDSLNRGEIEYSETKERIYKAAISFMRWHPNG